MSNCIPLDFLIEYNKKYPNIWKYAEKYQSEKDLWDDTICYFPIGASMGILQEFYNVPFTILTKDAYVISGLAGWRIDKKVYQYDEQICNLLFQQAENPEDLMLTTDVLRLLPSKSLYIKYPSNIINDKNNYVDGFLTWIENDMNDNSYELRIVHMGIINGSKTLISNEIIHLIKGKTISDGVDEAFELVKRQNDFGNKIISDIQQDKSFIKDYKIRISRDIQLILYLCASNADIEENPDQNKIYKFNHGIIKDKYREIKIYDVGYQLFSDIDNLEEVEPKKNSNNTGTSKSPHIRKAHWHHYWIGKENEKSKILKWLHPMFINLQKGKKSDKNKED